MAFALLAVMLAVAPAHALSRSDDGRVTLAVVDGLPCFAVDRYLGPISLIHTRKFKPQTGQFAVRRAEVRSARQPFGAVWQVEAPRDSKGWRLDPGQCLPMADALPGVEGAVDVDAWPLPAGLYRVELWAVDLKRGAGPRLSVVFCVLADGRLQNVAREDGKDVCAGEVIAEGRYSATAANLVARP